MLTELSKVKSRLALDDLNIQFDDLLTAAVEALSSRFNQETNRTLARTENATFEFDATDLEISVPGYPIESVTKFETKSSESEGWVEQTDVEYLIRRNCIISFPSAICDSRSAISLGRISYTGGYVLPGTDPSPGQTPLPPDLEQAAIEQVAAWFLRRDMVGLETNWPKGGILQRFSQLPLLPTVDAVLRTYQRWVL